MIAGRAKPLFRSKILVASIGIVVVIAAAWLIRDSAIYERTDEAQVGARILPLSARINGHVQKINFVDGPREFGRRSNCRLAAGQNLRQRH